MGSVSNPIPSPLFNELANTVTTTNAGVGAWENWDLSGTLPAGTVAALFLCCNSTNGGTCGVREDGSVLARNVARYDNGISYHAAICKVPPSRIVEIYQSHDIETFYCVGYWS